MIESPIRRKHIFYPKDFLPSNPRPATHNKKFALNEAYQIDADVIKKYSQSIEEEKKQEEKNTASTSTFPNPQKFSIPTPELNEDMPLGQHSFNKKPDINAEILKKPRFSLKHNEEIPESNEGGLQASTSPGGIRRQLADRQAPLPLQDPCRIELLQASNKISKIPESYIKYRAGSNIEAKTWRSSEKDIMEKFQESRMKRSMHELPVVNKHPLNHSFNAATARDLYDSFRKRQNSTAANFGKINSFLMSLKKEEDRQAEPTTPNIPKFQPSAIEKLKEDINQITKAKRRANSDKKEQEEAVENHEEEPEESLQQEKRFKRKEKSKSAAVVPEYLVSYRSSLSYLKDLFLQTRRHAQFRLTVKIPKLFTQERIYRGQQKGELYECAREIFGQLRIPCENLVIKRYTNCTMIISRNICLIWHFDGKRYLGGWQTDFLDEGAKHGLGLEWHPKHYVYYGEFARNKREGLGAYKDRNNAVYLGNWSKGRQYEGEPEGEGEGEREYQEQEDEEDIYENQDAYYQYL